jgi:hypothetical protein
MNEQCSPITDITRPLKLLLLLVSGLLVACEQVLVNGPVGGATITVQELRSGTEVFSNGVSKGQGDVPAFGSIADLEILRKLGQHQFPGNVEFTNETWYVISASQGFDFDADGDFIIDQAGPSQVFGTVHALVTGATLNDSGYAISPLTESAYQYVRDYVSLLTDEELQATLDAIAAELVGDVDNSGTINYTDVLLRNPIFNLDSLVQGKQSALDNLARALTEGDNAATVQQLAGSLFDAKAPAGIPEKIYADSISTIIVNAGCGPGCHYAPGIGASQSANVLVPPSETDFAALNTANFAQLVASNSVSYVLSKVQGGLSHSGGQRIQPGSANLQAFEDWLNLL